LMCAAALEESIARSIARSANADGRCFNICAINCNALLREITSFAEDSAAAPETLRCDALRLLPTVLVSVTAPLTGPPPLEDCRAAKDVSSPACW
jgi:hypothetical protein